MRLVVDRIEVPGGGRVRLGGAGGPGGGLDGLAASLSGPSPWPSELLPSGAEGERWSWRIIEDTGAPRALRRAALVFHLVDVVGPLRMFRHGYQSWSPCGTATFGIDRDPSLAVGSLELVRGVHQADQGVVDDPHELRSEWVTVLADDGGDAVLVGADGGAEHDTTFRLRSGEQGPELWCEAFLGDLVLGADEARSFHDLVVAAGAPAEDLLASWARLAGTAGGALTDAPYQVGWCSWYQYFHDVTESDIEANLDRVGDWPFQVFQVDDGYQRAIGDWLATNERFPSGLETIASRIRATGCRPGIWLAPFLAAPDSEVATAHPDWLARFPDGAPLITMFNPPWGGGLDGFMYGLDTSHPEVLAHLETVAGALVAAGFTYLKLDFTFSPSFDGVWHDRSLTPAQRVRAGFDAVRAGADRAARAAAPDEGAFLLGCGAPLAHVVGAVDGNRIGADVAPSWPVEPTTEPLAGYVESQPSTANAWRNTAARSFMHRRLWLNDPDCVMLRTDNTALGETAATTWAHAVGVSGGMALVSDDLSLLGPDARRLLDEVTALGRVADDAARVDAPPRPLGLMAAETPERLSSGAGSIVVEVPTGRSRLDRPDPPST